MTTSLRFRIAAGLLAALTVVAAFFVLNREESDSSAQSTDDAYVQADFTVIAPQVSGVINRLDVSDNQEVVAGAPLLRIDDRDLRIALERAQSAIESIQAQLELQQSIIGQAKAALATSEARLKLATANLTRFTNLAADGSGTLQALQQAQAECDIQRAAHQRDEAGLMATLQQTAVLRAELSRVRTVKDDAELKLSYAGVTSPVAGVIAQRRARLGGYARIGEPLLTIVPVDAVYVEANFRETQLAQMQVGQPVRLTVDALPGVKFTGRVESMGPASGASFSALPPHNASGNFTKIVQRLPVKIELDQHQKDLRRLRVGMSVHPTVDVR